ncbi:hypothetical protein HAX54_045452, partial [Datura stramonium]|nr:hypothetical protein [Datura stramonium]
LRVNLDETRVVMLEMQMREQQLVEVQIPLVDKGKGIAPNALSVLLSIIEVEPFRRVIEASRWHTRSLAYDAEFGSSLPPEDDVK